MNAILQELRRRKVFRVAVVYSVVAWVIIQIADVIMPALQMPGWTISFVTILLLLGFPLSIILAWAYEITPEGIKPDHEVSPQQIVSSRNLHPVNYLILLILVIIVIFEIANSQFFTTLLGSTNSNNGFDGFDGNLDEVIKVDINLGQTDAINNLAGYMNMDISSDGSKLVYSRSFEGRSYLEIRPFNLLDSEIIFESDSSSLRGPKFSPDGSNIIFRSDTNILIISTEGGITRRLASGVGLNGYAWTSNEQIVYSDLLTRSIVIATVSTDARESLLTHDNGIQTGAFYSVPNTSSVLYTEWDDSSDPRLKLLDLETKEVETLLSNAFQPTYIETGHILFVRESDLWAIQYDPDTKGTTGDPFPILSGIDNSQVSAYATYTVSDQGRLIYLPTISSSEVLTPSDLVLMEEGGSVAPLGLPLRDYRDPVMSPSGEMLAFRIDEIEGNRDIWTYDFTRKSLKRITTVNSAQNPIWNEPRNKVLFEERTKSGIFQINSNGTGSVEPVFESTSRVLPQAVSPDGNSLIFNSGGFSPWDLHIADIDQLELTNSPLIASEFNETQAKVSPDGKWLAYVSDETGNNEVYISSFPDPLLKKERVSITGGWEPLWTSDSKKIYYINPLSESIVYREIVDGENLYFGDEIFFGETFTIVKEDNPNYAITPDGSQIVLMRNIGLGSHQLDIVLVENWFAEFLDISPNF